MESNKSALIIDDDNSVRRLMALVLGMAGWRTWEADSPDTALKSARELRRECDLLVLDLHIHPAYTGTDLQKQLKRLLPQAKTLFVTGGLDDDSLEAELQAADCRLLTKPFTPTDLVHSAMALTAHLELNAR